MAIAQDGFMFLATNTHGDLIAREPFDLPMVRYQPFGVLGESHVLGEGGGRDLTVEITLSGYATEALLMDEIEAIEDEQGRNGDVVISGSRDRTEPDCTFMGFVVSDPGNRLDGSGAHGWYCRGILHFRQRQRA